MAPPEGNAGSPPDRPSEADGDGEGLSRGQLVAGLLGVGALVVVTRSYIYGSVFRKGDVVLLANDPYFHRFRAEVAVSAAAGVFDAGALTAQSKGSPLLTTTLAAVTELLGGAPETVGPVIAVYPVVSAVVTAGLTYWVAARLTGSGTVGLLAGTALAITPIHALRTALGFGDHHAFDYPWIVLALLVLVALSRREPDPRSREGWLLASALGVAVGGQVAGWVGGVALIVPVGLYAAARVPLDLREGRSPAAGTWPVAAGSVIGAFLVGGAHVVLGWHPGFVPAAVAALAAGVGGVIALGELARRRGVSAGRLLAVEATAAAGAAALLLGLAPFAALRRRTIEYVELTRLPGTVAEGVSMFGGPAGPVTGPASLFAGLLFLALPYLFVLSWRVLAGDRPGWLALGTYTWYFLAAATVQRRFAGELSAFVAVLAAVGIVDLAARIGVLEPPALFGRAPSGLRLRLPTAERRIYPLAVVILLLVSASFVQVPIRMNQATHDAAEHDAARWMADYADERDLSYPEVRVLSWWGNNRMYNYFVSGHAVPNLRYQYARSRYMPFLASTSPVEQYRTHRGQVGFIVTTDEFRPDVQVVNASTGQSASMYARLHGNLGSASGGVPGLGHYRALYASPDGSVKVFTLVPGATVTGSAPAATTVTVTTEVRVPGRTFTYRREVEPRADGSFSVTVPYPGRYRVGADTVSVPETAVRNNGTVSVPG